MQQVSVDAGKVHAVVQWQQNECHCKVPNHVANDHLKIAKTTSTNRAGNTDERNPAKGCAYHAKGHQHPVAAAVANEESIVVTVAAGVPSHDEQQQKIAKNDCEK